MKRALKKLVMFFEKYELVNFGKNHKTIICLTACLIFGMIAGSVSMGTLSMEALHRLDFLFLNDFKERTSQSGIDVFISSFSSVFVFAAFAEIFALSFWGVALIPALLVFKGLGLGLIAGYLYVIYGLKGIAFYILVLLPGIFVSSLGLILLFCEAVKFSKKFAQKIFPGANGETLWAPLKHSIQKSGYALVILALSSLLDMCFMAMFSKFFEF